MKERPILYSTAMVQAILEGRKTQTRRILKGSFEWLKNPASFYKTEWENRDLLASPVPMLLNSGGECAWYEEEYPEEGILIETTKCPYGQKGDKLWVRETFTATNDKKIIIYKAEKMFDTCKPGDIGWNWTPSIFMPRVASRINLTIKNIRVERLQDITEEDAIAEGVEELESSRVRDRKQWKSYLKNVDVYSAWASYSTLWESINGKGSWEANPWVWVIVFENTKPVKGEGK